jgi:hypothetical protein
VKNIFLSSNFMAVVASYLHQEKWKICTHYGFDICDIRTLAILRKYFVAYAPSARNTIHPKHRSSNCQKRLSHSNKGIHTIGNTRSREILLQTFVRNALLHSYNSFNWISFPQNHLLAMPLRLVHALALWQGDCTVRLRETCP